MTHVDVRGRLNHPEAAMSRYLYLVRHGEQQDAQHGLPDGPLSARGVRQAEAVAERLSGVPFSGAWTSPLQRAQETARIMSGRLPALTPEPSALLMDCVPSGPTPDLPHAWEHFFGAVTAEEIEAGQAQMADAVAEWLAPSREDRHDLRFVLRNGDCRGQLAIHREAVALVRLGVLRGRQQRRRRQDR